MPHIIIEHSKESIEESNCSELLNEVFAAVASIDLFNSDNIKVRLNKVEQFKLAIPYQNFIHIQCRIHSGRDREQKTKFSETVLQAVKQFTSSKTVITVEVIDMDTSSYAKAIT